VKRSIYILILSFLFVTTASSQDTITKKEYRKQQKNFLLENRSWTAELPLWIPGYAGSFAYGDIDIEGEDGVDPEQPVEPPPGGAIGEILSRLFTKDWYFKFFYMTRVVYEKNRLLFQLDGITGAIGTSVKFNYNNKEVVQVNFRSSNARLYGAYKFFEHDSDNSRFRYELFGYLGLRWHLQEIYSDLNGAINTLDIHPMWFEPLIGVYNQFTFKRWLIVAQADYGGLFDNEKYSVQVLGFAYYRTGKITSLKFGWNHLQLYDKGIILKQEYRIRTILSGPSVGIAFHF